MKNLESILYVGILLAYMDNTKIMCENNVLHNHR